MRPRSEGSKDFPYSRIFDIELSHQIRKFVNIRFGFFRLWYCFKHRHIIFVIVRNKKTRSISETKHLNVIEST